MAKCDLCSDESTMLYTVVNPKNPEGEEYHLCDECLEMVHKAYIEIK